MVGNNLTDLQLQQLVDRTIIKADLVKKYLFIGLWWKNFISRVQKYGKGSWHRWKIRNKQNLRCWYA